MAISESLKAKFKGMVIFTLAGYILGLEAFYFLYMKNIGLGQQIILFLLTMYFWGKVINKQREHLAMITNQPMISILYDNAGLIIGACIIILHIDGNLNTALWKMITAGMISSLLFVVLPGILVGLVKNRNGISMSADKLKTAMLIWGGRNDYLHKLEKIVWGYKPPHDPELNWIKEEAEKYYYVLMNMWDLIEECENALGNKEIAKQLEELRNGSGKYLRTINELIKLLKMRRYDQDGLIESKFDELMETIAYLQREGEKLQNAIY